MTLFKYILKNDSIDFKYLFKALKKNILTIIISTLIIFILSSFYAYKKMAQQVHIKIYFEQDRNIKILNEKYRKALSTNATFRKFLDDFITDFFKSYSYNLEENNTKNYKFVNKNWDQRGSYFEFLLDLNLLNVPTLDRIKLIKNEFELIFNKTLSQEANKYLLAVDIDYKILNKSINVRKIVATKFNEKSFILILISTFLTSLIISVLFIFFKKYK